MPIKTILAYLPSEKSVDPVLDAALKIGGEQAGHIIGLHVIATYPIYSEYAVAWPEDVIEQMNRPAKEAAEAIHQAFDERMKSNIISHEWRCLMGDISEVTSLIVDEAHAADLVVCLTHTDAATLNAPGLPDRLIMESGRPVLLLPKTASSSDIGKRVIIAWNNTREAARAVFDALDLIKQAALVRLVTFIDSERQRPAALVAGSNLMSSLERHGIHATLDIYATGENTAGDHLLSRVVDEGCDLLIMGCYGHSRLREMIFGGVSQKILAETWVPTLMSH